MSIEDGNMIDVSGISKNGELVLTISDHLDWGDAKNHLLLLQQKVNTYLAFIESGQIYEEYPDQRHLKIVIEVYAKHQPTSIANGFFEKVTGILANAGYEFRFRLGAKELP